MAITDQLDQLVEPGRSDEDAALVEMLAEYAHEAWSGWMRYMLERVTLVPIKDCPDGWELWPIRWRRLMNTPYSGLTEQEKESDREEAREILARLRRVLD